MPGNPNRLDTLKTLRAANLDGAFATAFITLVGGNFIVGFLKEIGAKDIWLGLLTAIPAICGLAQIPGSVWGRSFVSFKKYVAPGGLIWRLLHIPLCVLPVFTALNDNFRLTTILIFSGIASLVVNLVNPIYGDWLARLVPDSQRGAFYGKRNSLMAAIGTGTGLLGGLLVDALKKVTAEPQQAYSGVFVFGLICSFVSMHFFSQMSDVEREEPIKANLRETGKALVSPFQNRQFRKLILFLFVFIAGQSFAGSLWAAYAIENLKFTQTQLQLLGLFHAAGNILMSKWWGFLADKYGNKPILAIVGMGMLLTPTAWLFTHGGAPGFNMVLLYSTHILMGMVWSGVALCQYNIIFSTSPAAERSTYLGSAMAVQSVAGAVPPLLGAAMLGFLRDGHSAEVAYKLTFCGAIVIRFVALLLLIPVREEGSASFRSTVENLKSVTPRGIRAMRKFTTSGDATEREHAIQRIAGQGFTLATDELIKALHDPSPRVRRQAASALGRLGDTAAVEELIHQLREHPDLVEEETVEALGDLGDPSALSELIKVLDAPRSVLRRAAARSIAQIPGAAESRETVDALIHAAENPSDPDLRRSALQALRNLEAPGIEATVSHALVDKHPSVRIAAAEAAGELELKSTAEACRASLVLYDDEGCAEVAYALGVNGNLEDAPRILAVAKSCVSMTTRRRCLLGVARLFGVESQAYRAMMTAGMERDQLIMTLLTVGGKRSKHANAALEAHAEGNEAEAIKALSLGREAAILTEFEIPEVFLLACVIYSERMATRTGR